MTGAIDSVATMLEEYYVKFDGLTGEAVPKSFEALENRLYDPRIPAIVWVHSHQYVNNATL